MTARFVFKWSTAYLAVTATEVVASFASVPIMTRLLSPADYALMLLIANAAALVNLMLGFTLAQALPPLLAGTASLERRRAVATTILAAIADPKRLRIVVDFPPRPARFIRLRAASGVDDAPWTIAELEVWSSSAEAP